MNDLKELFRIAKLIAKERVGEITQEEKKEIENWVKQNPGNSSLYKQLKEDDDIYKSLNNLDGIDTKISFKNIWNKINQEENVNKRTIVLPKIVRYAAAVLLLIASSLTVYFVIQNNNNQKLITDIEPGTQRAILITADNQQIELGINGVKQLFRNKKLCITDTAQTLTYEIIDSPDEEVIELEYNQVLVPRGGEYSLVLADGSKVKLNAESHLRFPVSFDENIREVELEGEAYFEVQKSEDTPFIVHTKDIMIRVYGTSFNVSAYNNDNITHTTLIEGSVGVKLTSADGSGEVLLNPGEQANYNRQSSSIELREVNVELYTAWVNGLFVFENEPLEDILKKLSRWYDFEVDFSIEDLKYRAFTGDLKRYNEISTILNMISIASDLEFAIKERTVIVSEAK